LNEHVTPYSFSIPKIRRSMVFSVVVRRANERQPKPGLARQVLHHAV
jgi:hypothetical protein